MSLLRTVKFILSHPLAGRRPLASLAKFVKWQVGSRLVPGAVVYSWVDRSRILVHRGETGLTGNIYAGLHEFEDMAFLLHLLRREDLFVDVGANVGAYSVLACAVTAAHGFAFEPVPSAYLRLLDNVRLNRAETRIKCINMAVADVPGIVAFSSANDTTNHAIVAGEHRGDAIDVEVTTLDIAIAESSPTLIKIDVEGYETLVIRGGQKTLSSPTLLAVIMELNGNGRRYGFDDEHLVAVMDGLGFVPCMYEPFSRHLAPLATGSRSTGNVIFVRDFEAVRLRLRTAKSVIVSGIQF